MFSAQRSGVDCRVSVNRSVLTTFRDEPEKEQVSVPSHLTPLHEFTRPDSAALAVRSFRLFTKHLPIEALFETLYLCMMIQPIFLHNVWGDSYIAHAAG